MTELVNSFFFQVLKVIYDKHKRLNSVWYTKPNRTVLKLVLPPFFGHKLVPASVLTQSQHYHNDWKWASIQSVMQSAECRASCSARIYASHFHILVTASRLTSPYGCDGLTNYYSAVLLTHENAIWHPCIIEGIPLHKRTCFTIACIQWFMAGSSDFYGQGNECK